jgi:hypothetical protein
MTLISVAERWTRRRDKLSIKLSLTNRNRGNCPLVDFWQRSKKGGKLKDNNQCKTVRLLHRLTGPIETLSEQEAEAQMRIKPTSLVDQCLNPSSNFQAEEVHHPEECTKDRALPQEEHQWLQDQHSHWSKVDRRSASETKETSSRKKKFESSESTETS